MSSCFPKARACFLLNYFLLIYLVTLPERKASIQWQTYFLYTSYYLGYYGQHIEGELKLINCKIYPHVLNYSAINLTCV